MLQDQDINPLEANIFYPLYKNLVYLDLKKLREEQIGLFLLIKHCKLEVI